jgi:hypothetical protein
MTGPADWCPTCHQATSVACYGTCPYCDTPSSVAAAANAPASTGSCPTTRSAPSTASISRPAATTLREQLVAQRITTEEITYITDKLIPTVEHLAGLADDDNAEAIEAIKKLVSVEMLTVLQLVGFNFKAAIGEPLTQLVEGLILPCAEPITLAAEAPSEAAVRHRGSRTQQGTIGGSIRASHIERNRTRTKPRPQVRARSRPSKGLHLQAFCGGVVNKGPVLSFPR